MSGREYAPPSGSVFRHRKTGKTKVIRFVTHSGVHWTGEYGEWRYECWDRWNSWIKSAEDITQNAAITGGGSRPVHGPAEGEENDGTSLLVRSDALLTDCIIACNLLQDAPEIDPCNYNHEDVCRLNAAACEAYQILNDAIKTANRKDDRT